MIHRSCGFLIALSIIAASASPALAGVPGVTPVQGVDGGTPLATDDLGLASGSAKAQQVDGSGNTLGTAAHPTRTDPTGTTTQPVSMASPPVGASTAANQATELADLATMIGNLNTLITNLGNPLQTGSPVNLASVGMGATSANQNTQNVALGNILTTLGGLFPAGGSIGNTSFGIAGNLPAFASTPTFNLGSLNGAATAAGQASILAALANLFQSGGSISNTGFAINGLLPAFAATPTFNLGSVTGSVPVTGTFWQSIQPVSATSLPLPSGAATDASLTSGNAKAQQVDGTGNTLGTAAHPTRTDPTGTTTQPVSAAALPLPTGAATDATLTNGNQKTQVTSLPAVSLTTTATRVSPTCGASPCAVSSTAVDVLAANPNRKSCLVQNLSTTAVYCNFATAASKATTSSVYDLVLNPGATAGTAGGQLSCSDPAGPFTGPLNCVSTSTTSLAVSELQQ